MLGNIEALETVSRESRVVITSHEPAAAVARDSGWGGICFWMPPLDFSDRFDWMTKEVLGALQQAKSIVLALDYDEQGRKDIGPLAYSLGRGRCRFVQYPDGVESLAQLEGALEEVNVRRILDRAPAWATPSVRKASELPPRPLRMVHSTGIEGFDHHFRVREGDVSVWSGIPGHGKTTFLNHVMLSLADSQGWNVCFCSFEQDTVTNHVPNIRKWLFSSPRTNSQPQRKQIDHWIDDKLSFVDPQSDESYEELTLDWVEDTILKAVRQFGAQIYVLDPWNEIEHDKPSNLSMHDYIGKALRRIKRIARDLNVHIAIVAHPTKLKTENGPPGMYDISDSSHWANKPDQVVVVHRPAMNEHVEVYIRKCRFQELGRVGKAGFLFNPLTNRYQYKPDTENSREAEV